MKKKNTTFRKKFKMPYLFREDLEEIENIIKTELKPREFKMSTKEYEYDNLELMPKNSESINEFYIKTHSPYISIDFYGHDAQIYAGDDDIKTIGAVVKIIKVISERERKILWYCYRLSLLIGLAILIFVLTSGFYNRIVTILFIFLLLLIIIWTGIITYIEVYRFSVINFNYSKENLNFIKRNKDQIILLILSAILGALATILITKIF